MQYENRSFWGSIAPVTRHLLVINVIMWLATIVFQRIGLIDLQQWLGLHFWKGSSFNVLQVITYMFMHDTSGFLHIFFNMFMLWMFGSTLERALGSKRYLFYYISCGIGAAFVQELVWQLSWENILATRLPASVSVTEVINTIDPVTLNAFFNSLMTVGASGAIFGLLLAFGMLFPNLPLLVIPFPFPIKAKWLVLGYGLLELFLGVSDIMSSVAHFAHLGGMIAGIIMILYWKHNGTLTRGGNGFY